MIRLYLLLIAAPVLNGQILSPVIYSATGGCCTYYVDPVSGNDANAGTTTALPFKTINHTNGLTGAVGLKVGSAYRLFTAPRQSLNDYWDLTGSPGNSVSDLSGGGNTLTNGATTHAATSTANGYVFAGAQGASAAAQATSAVTMIMVVNPTVAIQQFTFCNGTSQDLCALYDYATTPSQTFEMYSGAIAIRTAAGTYPLAVGGGQWVDLAYTYSSATSAAGYLNGIQYFSTTTALTKTLGTTGWFVGSYSPTAGSQGLTGTIAAVMIYNRVLSATEIASADAYIRQYTPLGAAVIGPRPPASGLLSRYRSDTILQANGLTIPVWPDTVAGHHLTQATNASRPLSDVVAGRAYASFNASSGTSMFSVSGLSWDRRDAEIYVIWRPSGGEGVSTLIHDSTGKATLTSFGTAVSQIGQLGLTTSDVGNVVGATPYPNQSGLTISSFASTASGATFYAGLKSSAATALSSQTITPDTVSVASGSIAGDVAEILVYGTGRDVATRTSVLAYAAAKYPDLRTTAWTNLAVFDGNSITSGNKTATNYPNLVMDTIASTWGGVNVGVAGATTENLTTNGAAKVDVLFDGTNTRNVLVIWEGSNSMNTGGDTAAQALTALSTYVAARRAAHAWTKIIFATVLPRTDGGAGAPFETARQTYNTALRSNPGAIYGDILADVGNDATIGQAGQSANTTYYADLVHLTPAGKAIAATYFVTGINSVP